MKPRPGAERRARRGQDRHRRRPGAAHRQRRGARDPEFFNRIARIQIQHLEKRLAQMEMKLEVSDAALAELAKAGFDPVYGARPLKRAIRAEIENPLAKEILSGRFGPKDTIRVEVEGGRFVFENVIEAEVV